ncbi:MAG: TadE family protein [Terracidiphilus sp.]
MKRLSNVRGQVLALLLGFCRAKVSGRAGANARTIGGRLRTFLYSENEGQTLTEFAVALPMLMMVLTFMFAVTMAMISYEQLIGAVNGASTQILYNAYIVPDPCASIQTMVDANLPGSFDRTKLTFTVTIQDSTGKVITYGPTTGAGFSCAAANGVLNSDLGAGETYTNGTLTVSYPYTWLPVFAQKLSGNMTVYQAEPVQL